MVVVAVVVEVMYPEPPQDKTNKTKFALSKD